MAVVNNQSLVETKMIDFIKYVLINPNIKQLEENTLLEFVRWVNETTGELGFLKFASYKGLKFKIYDPTDAYPNQRVTVEGSLHKYWNNGEHNYNDFGIEQIEEVLQELKDKFGIKPENCILRQLEIGVNIEPPVNTEVILNNCLLHKTSRFKWVFVKDEGIYIQVQRQRYIVKIYDKRLHYTKQGYKIKNEILRFEIKFLKMISLNELGILNLAQLLEYGLHKFIPLLLQQWENVLFFDFITLKVTKNELKYSNQNYWAELNLNRLKYHRDALNILLNTNPQNIKKQIADLIKKKATKLCTKTS